MYNELFELIEIYAEQHSAKQWAECVSSNATMPEAIHEGVRKARENLDHSIREKEAELEQLRYLWRRLEPYIPSGPNYVDFTVGGDGQEGMYNTRAFYKKLKNETQ